MNKTELKKLINRAESASVLFSYCNVLEHIVKACMDFPSYEETGLSSQEKDEIGKIGFDLYQIKARIGHLACEIHDDVRRSC